MDVFQRRAAKEKAKIRAATATLGLTFYAILTLLARSIPEPYSGMVMFLLAVVPFGAMWVAVIAMRKKGILK